MRSRTTGGSGQSVVFVTPPHCREQWVVGLFYYTAALHGGVGSGSLLPASIHLRRILCFRTHMLKTRSCVCFCIAYLMFNFERGKKFQSQELQMAGQVPFWHHYCREHPSLTIVGDIAGNTPA